jgi:aldehyde:ferredoxin oxidoreductase
MTTLSEVFFVCLVATISGMIIKLASMAYKSKCKECSVCCIKVVRDIDNEVKEDLALGIEREESKRENK